MIEDITYTPTEHQVDDLTAYELYQLVHYGNILPPTGSRPLTEEEQWQADHMKSEQWVNERLEKLMDDHIGY